MIPVQDNPVKKEINKDYDFKIIYYGTKPVDYKELVQKYILEGYGILETSRKVGLSKNQVKYLAHKHRFIRPDPEKINLHKKFAGTNYDGYSVYDMYVISKLTMRQIAEKCNTNYNRVRTILLSMGLDIKKESKKRPKVIKGEICISGLRYRRPFKQAIGLSRWRKTHGKRYTPLYEDVMNGMSYHDAYKKHNIPYATAYRHFKKCQNEFRIYLDWGNLHAVNTKFTEARLKQFARCAAKQNINVLDWIDRTLKSAGDKEDTNYDS